MAVIKCPCCGHLIEIPDDTVMAGSSDPNGSGENKNRILRIGAVVAAVLLTALVAVAVGIGLRNREAAEEAARSGQERAEEEAARIRLEKEAAEEAIRRSQEYEENLRLVVDIMLSGAVDAEECCNLTVQVWNNAIWEKEDDATNPYTKPERRFVTDFNDALYNLYADPEFCAKLDDIMENQRTVDSIVGVLKNPPEEYKAAYASLAECYEAYRTFTDMAVNPMGSLETFSAAFNEADTEFIRCYRGMQFYLQD